MGTADTASVKPRLSPRLRPKATAAMVVTDTADTASVKQRLSPRLRPKPTAAMAATGDTMGDTVVVMAVMVDTADTTVRFFILPHSLPHYDLQPQSKDIFWFKRLKSHKCDPLIIPCAVPSVVCRASKNLLHKKYLFL